MMGRPPPAVGAVTLTCRSTPRPVTGTVIGLIAMVWCWAEVGMCRLSVWRCVPHTPRNDVPQHSGTLFREPGGVVPQRIGAREASAQRTRQALLTAAAQVFVEQGVHAPIRDIAS